MSINLEKGQKINLDKQDGTPLTRIFMGLGWDVSTGIFGGGASIDLDASVAMYSENKEVVDLVSFKQLVSKDGSVRHSGDNLTGAGHGDDEVIHVDLSGVPIHVKTLVFTINSFRGQTFDKVKNAYARLVDSVNNQEVSIYKFTEKGSHTGLIMAKVYRHNNAWKMTALGIPCSGRIIGEIFSQIITIL